MYPIRHLDLSDYDGLIRLWQICGLDHRPKGRDSREAMAGDFARAETCVLGMHDDNRLIGSIIGSSDGRKGWINRLAVDPDYRGRDLGGLLISACEDFLHGLGIRVIAALIEDENTPSMTAFAKAGYEAWENIVYFSKRPSWHD
ncbi:MAG: GNAT family N-acetyltransferase [Candidatus Zixiibacteriota bacterium]|nr:MAG: GNAT family N-acetyltransferase [candidate division Zixibacteria bacterium]